MSPDEFELRILSLLDGCLPPAEAAELEASLLESPEAMAAYLELVQLHNALESRFATVPKAQQASVVPMERVIAAQQRRVIRGSLLAAAAILVLSAVAMWMILAPDRSASLGSIQTSADSVLTLTHEGAASGKPAFAAGSRVRLSRGTMEGVFESGVRFVAEAPCELHVAAPDEVEVDAGRVWFEVPAPAVGFTVRTPRLEIVDLGTEFGVVSPGGTGDEVHVLKGSVRVAPRPDGAAAAVLRAGEARRLDAAGVLLTIGIDRQGFRTELDPSREIAIANASFEDDRIPRDGDPGTREPGADDYDKDLVPSGWVRFSDGRGQKGLAGGVISTAAGSFFGELLAPTPDEDANDQTFYSGERDLYQVLAEPLRPNCTYVLSADIGDWLAGKGFDGEPGNPGLRLGVGDEPGAGLLKPHGSHRPPQIDGQWVRWSVTYQTDAAPAGAGEPLRIELTSDGRMSWFDRVRLTVSPAPVGDR